MDADGKFDFSDDTKIFSDQTVKFDIYKLDFSRNTWEFAKCIGDQALFLGINQSLSLSTRDFPDLQANWIHFTDDSFTIHKKYPTYGGPRFWSLRARRICSLCIQISRHQDSTTTFLGYAQFSLISSFII